MNPNDALARFNALESAQQSHEQRMQEMEFLHEEQRRLNQGQLQLNRTLQENLTVMAAIQQRQAEVQKHQAEQLVAHDTALVKFRETLVAHDAALARFRETMDEFFDKLHGVIGYLDNLPRQPPS